MLRVAAQRSLCVRAASAVGRASRAYSAAADRNSLLDVAEVANDSGDALKKDFWENKKVVLFGVPGAFTPVCTSKHVPSFIENLPKLKESGVDAVACLSVNDRFVLQAWREKLEAPEELTLLADWNGELAKHIGMDIDLGAAGLGPRCKRFAMIVDNGKIVHESVELSPGDFEVTSAESILAQLGKAE